MICPTLSVSVLVIVIHKALLTYSFIEIKNKWPLEMKDGSHL